MFGCKVSTTLSGLNVSYSDNLMDVAYFRDCGIYLWDKQMPRYYSVQTIWAESALKAIHENKIKVNLNTLNVARILAKSTIDAPNNYRLFFAETLKVVNNKWLFCVKLFTQIIGLIFKIYCIKIINKLRNMFFSKMIRLTNINNIDEATKQSNFIIAKYDLKNILESYNFPKE